MHILDLHFRDYSRAISAFLVPTTEGPVLIESGPHSTWPALTAALAEHGVTPKDVRHALLSHIHFDHAGAAWALAQEGTLVHVHPRGAAHLANPEKLYNSARMIYGDQMDALWGAMQTIDPEMIRTPQHLDNVQVGAHTFTALHTPGHAVHHIAWSVQEAGSNRKVICTGDVAGVKIDGGPVMPPCPPPDIHIEDWLESIAILRAERADALYLTHFGIVTEVDAHLDALAAVLRDWAEWMRPHHEAQTPQEVIVPQFEAWVEAALTTQGVDQAGLQRYRLANPAFMSVAGLMRYWKKRDMG